MQLTPQESASAFWKGARAGAVRSLGYILAVGVPLVGLMLLEVLPAVSITVGLMSALSTALTVGMFSGHNAVAQYHQQKHNQLYEAKIARLEGHVPGLDIEPNHPPVHSPHLSTLLREGARDTSFAAAEEERANTPTTRTLH